MIVLPCHDKSCISLFNLFVNSQVIIYHDLEIVLEHGCRFHELEILQGQVVDVVIKRLMAVIKILSPEGFRVRFHKLFYSFNEVYRVPGERFKLDSHLLFRCKRATDTPVSGEVVRRVVILHVRKVVLVNILPNLPFRPKYKWQHVTSSLHALPAITLLRLVTRTVV